MNPNIHRLRFELNRIRKLPIPTLATRAILKVVGLALGALLVPVTAVFHLRGYRHVNVFTDRIGHLALEPDCLIKEQTLGYIKRRKWIMLAPPGRVANEHLLAYWQSHFQIVRDRAMCFLIANMSRWGLMRYNIDHYVRAIGKAQAAYRIYAEWKDRPPILSLSAEDQAWGSEMLIKLGIPQDAWFVCVHARESGYSPVDEKLHSHRNSRIENTFSAMQEVVKRGGWVVRIGDPSMTELPTMERVIDYAHHHLKSARLDIILCAKARVILGNTSGIALVGTVFGTPCALANMVPASAMGVSPTDISIPKLYWSKSEKRHLSFSEIFESKLSRAQYHQCFENEDIKLEENSPEDINDLLLELISREELEEQPTGISIKFYSLISEHEYSFGHRSKIGETFINKHKNTLFAETIVATSLGPKSQY